MSDSTPRNPATDTALRPNAPLPLDRSPETTEFNREQTRGLQYTLAWNAGHFSTDTGSARPNPARLAPGCVPTHTRAIEDLETGRSGASATRVRRTDLLALSVSPEFSLVRKIRGYPPDREGCQLSDRARVLGCGCCGSHRIIVVTLASFQAIDRSGIPLSPEGIDINSRLRA